MNIRKLSNEIKKYANFDQQKALGVLERYGRGHFEEVMDYDYPSVRAFYASAVTFVSMKDRPKFKKALEEEFNEKIAGIADTLFKKQIFEYDLEVPVRVEIFAKDNVTFGMKDWLEELEDHFETRYIIKEVEDIMDESKDHPADDESLDDEDDQPETEELDFDGAFEKWLEDNGISWQKWLDRDMKMDVDLGDFEFKDDVFDAITEDFNESELEKYADDGKLKDIGIISMRVTDSTTSGVVVTVVTNKKLDRMDLDAVIDYISGQCSDGWGEGFSQRENKINKNISYYIHTWWHERYPGIKLIKERPVQIKREWIKRIEWLDKRIK